MFLITLFLATPLLEGGSRRLSQAALKAALTYSRSQNGIALLIEERGIMRLEQYAKGVDPAQPQPIRSGGKNLWALATLVAAQEGCLDLDEPASRTLLEWADDPRKSRITLRQLLSCSAGLDPAVLDIQSVQVPDKVKVALQVPTLAEPGTRFDYGPATFTILGEVLRRKLETRKMGTLAYLQSRVLDPLDLDGKDWVLDGMGQPIYYAGLKLSARDWLKVGQMLLDRGQWRGRTVMNSALLHQALEAKPTNAAYGLSFWLNEACAQKDALEADVERWIFEPERAKDWPRACLSRHAPRDLFACIGSGGQRIYVVPSRQLVVVHLGRSPKFVDGDFLACLFR